MKTFKQFNEGLVKKALIGGALAAPYLLKKFAKPKTDKMLDKQRKTSPIGGDKRVKDTENAAGAPGFFDK
tara:strand:- start:848 stop:1057 length:210 start_codon:yes stop_codon:yes gene_type:complete